MEFNHIGGICFKCKRQDFCPICCDKCNEMFCHDHYNQDKHACNVKKIKLLFIDCPMCKKKLKVRDSVDVTVNKHLDKDCIKLHRHKYCTLKKCKYKHNIICKLCNKKYCISHRNTHTCLT